MRLRFLLLVSAIALLTASAAQAIVGGEPDNGAHPYVAAISNGSDLCTGTAISPTILVTAAHCFTFPSEPVRVIFDDDFRSSTRTLVPGTWYAHPQFCATCTPDRKDAIADVAVVVLDEPVSLPRYAQLPALGLVDRLAPKTAVEIVGYGVQEFDNRNPVSPSGLRMRAEAELMNASEAVQDELLKVSARPSKDRGASCFGDSGGPVLLGDTILGVTSFGSNDRCRAAAYAYRVDTTFAQSFIAGF